MKDGTIQGYWRKAVLKAWNYKCAKCGADARGSEVECHHFIKRKHTLSKHKVENGIPGCKYTCHRVFYHTKNGDRFVEEELIRKWGEQKIRDLKNKETTTIKQYLVDNGMSRKEWDEKTVEELKNG
jgi:hypothetical protein